MNPDQMDELLQAFARDPKQVMNRPLPKEDWAPQERKGVPALFSAEDRAGNAFVENRDSYRKKLSMETDGQLIRLEQVLPGRAPFANNDRVENLVDGPASDLLRTLEAMEARSLRQAKLDESPWSDWYWPIYQGILGCRYADPDFPLNSEDWKVKRDYVLQRPAADIVRSGNQEAINRLSPSEKYELIIGDANGTLTQQMWAEGEWYYKQSGKVERWMGICHGWAPVSYMLPRPRTAVKVLAADGRTTVLLYPSDLKALGSLLWAKGSPPVRFIGGRCNDKNPTTDDNGRVRSQQCFDTNPGTFHMALVNQIGLRRRSFIIDATFDYEVWNQPVFSYEYSYFNPRTRRSAPTLDSARVLRSEMTDDRFASYRSQNCHALVGINLKLVYGMETMPTTEPTDSPRNDYLRAVSYMYDLELDAAGRIIGGEWYTNLHPDFLWTPPPGAQARSSAEQMATGNWTDDVAPESWRRAALACARNGQVLARLVHTLIQWSHARG
ncbi:MAG: hypothetical protein RMK29_00075 [Myxococcales bacterium]|nr:hypothetical protein [Myxococcota bacterium]MDW8280071.1 hypothetical protein [Myxococcales bacterium]